jgi:amino-acid N-acetyltransferase
MTEPLTICARPPLCTVVALLQAQGLPVSDITDKHLHSFFYVGSGDSPNGLVGLELYGTDALLRSLVVGESARGKGLGSGLIDRAEQYAASKSARSIYLLTTAAEPFFKRLGYVRIDRSQAPRSIRRTSEFAGLCPTSSALMMKSL